ncbi:hypothetical protein V8J82_10860 [Gymnodinialimonas sp. 2305UL16-5]|uniref:hypothetical protein n=1 Tax=Gymnodinialimonas mytili TaxID=3126503 RepID=UPI0030AC187D
MKPIWQVGSHKADYNQISDEETLERIEASKKVRFTYQSGLMLSSNALGEVFSLVPEMAKPSGPQPIMNFGGDRLVVTAETRALLESLNPGPLQFHKIDVLNAERTKSLWEGADLHMMQVLECRRETLFEESGAIRPPAVTVRDGVAYNMITSTDGEDPMVVLPPAEGSAEIWIEDRLFGALFLTDRIAQALKAAKLTRGWGLLECRVKVVH